QSFFGLWDFRSKKGIVGHLVKGWTIAPYITFQSGPGTSVVYSNGSRSFGSNTPPGGDGVSAVNAVLASPFTGGTSAHYGVPGSNGVGTNNVGQLNMFTDPAATIAQFRRCFLGVDTSCGGYYGLR